MKASEILLQTPAVRRCVVAWMAAILLTALSVSAVAQPPRNPGGRGFLQEGQQRVEALRVAFITRELGLTADEAKVFWPVYEARESELRKARRDMAIEKFEAQLNFDAMSDADLEALMDKMIAFQQSEVDINKKFNAEFKKVLGIRRTAVLYRAEQKFKRELLNRIRQGMGGGPGGR